MRCSRRCAPSARCTGPSSIEQYPAEAGFWSVTTAEDVHAVSRDWQTYSSELGGVTVFAEIFPLELARAMFIGMDPPKHDKHQGAVPARLHAEADRRPRGRDPGDRRAGCSTVSRGARRCDLVSDVAQPVVSRVIGSFMGLPEEEDALWARIMNSALAARRPRPRARRHRGRAREGLPGDVRALPRR